MFFAITALGVSAVQILIGIAIGMSVRKSRQRQLDGSRAQPSGGVRNGDEHPLPATAQADERSALADPVSVVGQLERAAKPQPVELTSPSARMIAEEPVGTQANDKQPIAAESVLPTGKDRRQTARQIFEYRQSVAPYQGGLLPGKASFREVECQDISSTGFSFLSSQLPDFDSIVVALGVAPHLVYLHAQIVNRFQVVDGSAPIYRIGCRFVGPVN
ncbi:MAG TPA: hypothetical protein VHC22_25460 [Pirellulales bacterium]|nr:hypothetical protein [Pirellulales bacterium]